VAAVLAVAALVVIQKTGDQEGAAVAVAQPSFTDRAIMEAAVRKARGNHQTQAQTE
jgi:hypothetical protein